MTELERRALMGDKQAQEECTKRGIALPCQLCGFPCRCNPFRDCCKAYQRRMRVGSHVASLEEWNNRLKPPTEQCKDCERWLSYSGKSKYSECQLSEDGLSCRFSPSANKKTRLIDAENYKEALRNLPNRATKEDAITLLDLMPTIDLQSLPIVQELTEQLAQALAERDKLLREQDGIAESLSSLNERFAEALKELGVEGCEENVR